MALSNLFRKRQDIVWRIIDNEGVLLNLENNYYYSLNDTGTLIYKMLDKEPMTGEAILDLLASEFNDVNRETLKQDLSELLEDLIKEGLVEEVKDSNRKNKMADRHPMKKKASIKNDGSGFEDKNKPR